MTATPPSPPLLGMYIENGSGVQQFPGAPSAWPSGATTNIANAYFAFDASDQFNTYGTPFIQQCGESGLIPFVELEPWDYDQTAVLFSAITGGTWDTYLEQVGAAIAALGSTCILTFAHEFNVSGQYPWSYSLAGSSFTPNHGSGPSGAAPTAAQWVTCWKYVHDKVRASAGGHDLWMWACSADTGGSTTESPVAYWPGSSYADMVGIDGYEALEGSPTTFAGEFGATLTDIRSTIGWSGDIYVSETNLALMVEDGGDSIAAFVADMAANGMSGILEFEVSGLPSMTSPQWTAYNNAVAANYGGGGGGGGGGSATYTQTLIDAFPGSTLNSGLWTEPVNTNGISVSGGTLKVQGLTNSEQVVLQTSFSRNLADGIFGLQLSQSGTGVHGTMWFLGVADGPVSDGGNAYEFQTFPAGGSAGGAGSWYSWAFSGTDVSGDTGDDDILSPSVWHNGDWLAIGDYNLNGSNDVHVYKSSDGETFTEIASFEVTGAINEATTGFYFGTNYDDGTTGTSTYLATIDNVSWFTRGTSAASSGTGTGGLVQWASNDTTETSLTLTLDDAITPGNTVALALSGYILGAVTEVTIGGTPVTFVKDATSSGYNAEIWVAEGVTEASAVIVVTASTPGIIGYAYELTGNRTVSVSAGTFGSGASWASGSTAEAPAAQHVVIGLAMCIDDSGSVTGPSSGGWASLPAYDNVESGSGGNIGAVGAVSGYLNSSGSAEYDYSGTLGTSGAWAAVTAAFRVVTAATSKLLMVGIA